jgi:hypothetical protein
MGKKYKIHNSAKSPLHQGVWVSGSEEPCESLYWIVENSQPLHLLGKDAAVHIL